MRSTYELKRDEHTSMPQKSRLCHDSSCSARMMASISLFALDSCERLPALSSAPLLAETWTSFASTPLAFFSFFLGANAGVGSSGSGGGPSSESESESSSFRLLFLRDKMSR